jgi:hypothetical protein
MTSSWNAKRWRGTRLDDQPVRALVLSLALLASACGGGGGGGGPTAPPATAVLTLSANPNPALGGPCTHCGSLGGQREVTTSVTVRESAGVAASAIEIGMTLRLASGEVLAQGTFNAAAIAQQAGSGRIPASGQLVIPIGVHYPENRNGLGATLHIDFAANDDNGHQAVVALDLPATT